MPSTKKLGQVFTPQWIVELMLNNIDFTGEHILQKRILEPSCGDGAFLVEVAKRIINQSKQQNLPQNNIIRILEENITGIELDPEVYQKCIENMNNIARQNDLPIIKWGIHNQDALKFSPKEKFDIIIGNPPYVRIHNLDEETRKYIKNNYTLNSGMIDLFMVFYELGMKQLKNDGILTFITPNSFLNTENARRFRSLIAEQDTLKKIINFRSHKIFNVGTYTSILEITGQDIKHSTVEYIEWKNNQLTKVSDINIDYITSNNWNFSSNENNSFIQKVSDGENVIGSIAKIQYGIETLRNKIFVSPSITQQENGLVLFNGCLVEEELLRPVIKGSTCIGEEPQSRIIWPYKKEKDSIIAIPEEEMIEIYPHTYQYFLQHKEELLKRNSDKGILWYQYGRSQGIKTLQQNKLVLKHSIKVDSPVKKISAHFYDENVMVYSGLFITGDNLDLVKKTIEDEDFFNYIILVGKDMSGGYKSYNGQQISRFNIKN